MKKNSLDDQAVANIPTFSYLIENLLLFEHLGNYHLVAAFENKSVQIFDFQSGLSLHEFDFSLEKLQRNRVKQVQSRETIRSNLKQEQTIKSESAQANPNSFLTQSRRATTVKFFKSDLQVPGKVKKPSMSVMPETATNQTRRRKIFQEIKSLTQMQVGIDDKSMAACMFGNCSCKCHSLNIPCDICPSGDQEPKLLKRDSFNTNKTDNLNERKRNLTTKSLNKALKHDSTINSSNTAHFEDDQRLGDSSVPKNTNSFESAGSPSKVNQASDGLRRSSYRGQTEDRLLKMIEKHKMERTRQPFGLDDKLFEFTQNNDFERAHRNLMNYMSGRQELQRETPQEMFKQQTIRNKQAADGLTSEENFSGGKKKVDTSSKEFQQNRIKKALENLSNKRNCVEISLGKLRDRER